MPVPRCPALTDAGTCASDCHRTVSTRSLIPPPVAPNGCPVLAPSFQVPSDKVETVDDRAATGRHPRIGPGIDDVRVAVVLLTIGPVVARRRKYVMPILAATWNISVILV